jgi:hypothetical protein
MMRAYMTNDQSRLRRVTHGGDRTGYPSARMGAASRCTGNPDPSWAANHEGFC